MEALFQHAHAQNSYIFKKVHTSFGVAMTSMSPRSNIMPLPHNTEMYINVL